MGRTFDHRPQKIGSIEKSEKNHMHSEQYEEHARHFISKSNIPFSRYLTSNFRTLTFSHDPTRNRKNPKKFRDVAVDEPYRIAKYGC